MAIEQLAEEVATNLEEAAEITRKVNSTGLGYLAVGLGIGAAIGFYLGYKYNREKIRAEAYKDAEGEVALLREVYLNKTLSATNVEADSTPLQGAVPTEKPPIEEIVEHLGYGAPIPRRERPLPAPVPILEIEDLPDDTLDDLPENPVGTSKSMNAGWNYEREARNRSPEEPYVIHQNEYYHSNPEYTKIVYTYYALDDVVADEHDHPVPHGDLVIGVDNLKFGHGADDTEVVFVRNDRLEMDMQICRIQRSFEEDILGLDGLSGNGDSNDDDDDEDTRS